jgi:catalase
VRKSPLEVTAESEGGVRMKGTGPDGTSRSLVAPLTIIVCVIGALAALFAYTAGWLSPARLTPDRFVDAFRPPNGEALGHRRNHAKGVCFTGVFEGNGSGASLSRAQLLTAGRYPVLGRFNLGVQDPHASDATARVRGVGILISTPDGQQWRSAMVDFPFFPVSTPQAFYELLVASKSKDPQSMAAFVAAHPEFTAFAAWTKSAPWTASYVEERYNGLNSFVFTDTSGARHLVRWSLVPAATPEAVSPEDLARRGSDFLEKDLRDRVAAGPVQWTLAVTVANPGDPSADPSKAWPEDRQVVDVGTLTVQQVQAERDGPCRDINYDPTVLPSGMTTSDDPFPAARSSVYAESYDRRTAEAAYYPR